MRRALLSPYPSVTPPLANGSLITSRIQEYLRAEAQSGASRPNRPKATMRHVRKGKRWNEKHIAERLRRCEILGHRRDVQQTRQA
jgi:arginine/lysine/ornithine decarboxylase